MKTFETKRLYLRYFTLSDANDLYEYAKNPKVGPMAGWKPHESLEEAVNITKIFIVDKQYALVYKENNKVIGSIGWQKLKDEKTTELGFALSEDYWGVGLMPEAVEVILKHLFLELKFKTVYIGHFDFNLQSKRVIEKAGFKYSHTSKYIRGFDNKEIEKLNYKMSVEDYKKIY